MQSFINLKIPCRLDGTAESIVNLALSGLYKNSQSIELILATGVTELLSRLTWGFSHAPIEGQLWTLNLGGDLTSKIVDNPFSVPDDETTRYRLGAIKYLISKNKIEVKSISGELDFDAAILFTDHQGFHIACEIHAQPSEDDEPKYRARFTWAQGTPKGTKLPVIHTFKKTSYCECLEIKAELERTLSSIPSTSPPFNEPFDTNEADLLPGIKLFDHQKEAIANWENSDYKGIFHMCTGAGKTIAALAAVMHLKKKLLAEGKATPTVIITVPKKMLGDQWCEIIEKITEETPLKAYNSHQTWKEEFLGYMQPTMPGQCPSFIVTTYASFKLDHFEEKMRVVSAGGKNAILIADEMHNLTSKPDRLALENFSSVFTYRIGLSATPEIEGNESATYFVHEYFNAIDKSTASETTYSYNIRYDLQQGIREGVLCKYRYHPLPCHLSAEHSRTYLTILKQIKEQKNSKLETATTLTLYNERRDILKKSMVPIDRLEQQIKEWKDAGEAIKHTLVYCPPGNMKNDSSSDEMDDSSWTNLLNETTNRLANHGFHNGVIIGATTENQRKERLKQFTNGDLHTLCAIGCLDEGIDIPSINKAVVLYSVDREKQFIQRRGRILRKDKNSPHKIADIYDVILLPQGSHLPKGETEELLRKEMRRFTEFAELAINKQEAQEILDFAINEVINAKQSN